MKKLIYLLSLNVFFTFAITINVKAATYQADELTSGQHLLAGDVIEFGSGHFDNREYTQAEIAGVYGNPNHDLPLEFDIIARLNYNDSYVLTEDMYVYESTCGVIGENYFHICTELSKLYVRSFTTNGTLITPVGEVGRILKNPNEQTYIDLIIEGGTPPYTYQWYIVSSDNPSQGYVVITEDSHFIIPNNTLNLGCFIWDSTKETSHYSGVYSHGYLVEDYSNNTTNNTTNNEEKPDEVITQPQIPSTILNGTAQVSIGTNNKVFANIKALNQFPHDAVNQKIIADLYAKDQHKMADILMQKNIYPPHGVSNGWKNTSHTIRWKDLNVKKGARVVIVWYTPQFLGHKANLQMIQATVIEDGVIEFNIPRLGDMSVMSIVKLI